MNIWLVVLASLLVVFWSYRMLSRGVPKVWIGIAIVITGWALFVIAEILTNGLTNRAMGIAGLLIMIIGFQVGSRLVVGNRSDR